MTLDFRHFLAYNQIISSSGAWSTMKSAMYGRTVAAAFSHSLLPRI